MPEIGSARVALWTVFGTAVLLAVALVPLSSVRFAFEEYHFFALILGIAVPLAIYGYWRTLPALEAICSCSVFTLVTILPLVVLSYVAASCNWPLVDAKLIEWDQAIGFDWVAFVRWVDSSPELSRVLFSAYTSFGQQLLIIPVVLALAGQYSRAYVMLAAFGVASLVACAISVVLPALSAYSGHGIQAAEMKNIMPGTLFDHLPGLLAVRERGVFELSVGTMKGIITIPSMHAGMALLFAWATWRVWLLKYPVLILNILMSIAAISHGSHYLVDIFAGWAVVAFAIYAVLRFCRWYEANYSAADRTVAIQAV